MNEEQRKEALIKYRLEQAEETLKDAKILLKEGSLRGVVNRAYYAMFYAVLALLIDIGKGSSKHSRAIALFDRYFVKTSSFPERMSKALHKAFALRQTSDYRELTEISREDAEEILEEAAGFVTEVGRYLTKNLP